MKERVVFVGLLFVQAACGWEEIVGLPTWTKRRKKGPDDGLFFP